MDIKILGDWLFVDAESERVILETNCKSLSKNDILSEMSWLKHLHGIREIYVKYKPVSYTDNQSQWELFNLDRFEKSQDD